jgi:class 3 adenylate cyclase/KaiC/GvpD/RAD55 family RecA-like ATPase
MKHFPIEGIIGKYIKYHDIGVYLIHGPKASGKIHYCNNFILNGLRDGVFCICVSTSFIENRYKSIYFSKEENLDNKLKVLNPYVSYELNNTELDDKLVLTKLFEEIKKLVNSHPGQPVYLALSSLTNFLENFDPNIVLKFVTSLTFFLRNREINSIFAIDNGDPGSALFTNKIGHLFDGIFESKLPSSGTHDIRYIRLVSIKGNNTFKSEWIDYRLDSNNIITSIGSETNLICNLCMEQIDYFPVFHQDLAFHREHLNTYMKLISFYGSAKVTEFGSSGILHANFFFIDIVGLSDPSLSVKSQIEKIQILNNFLSSCNSYRKDRNKKILPTGDGMAIGFLRDPKLPVELSIELHRKLRTHNSNSTNQFLIHVRIGIGSGHVFVVTDLNDNQNLWGPGIILARRVMDLGDRDHILIEGGVAKDLFSLDDYFKREIHYLGAYNIKHNQSIDVYSLYNEFAGTSKTPQKFLDIHQS